MTSIPRSDMLILVGSYTRSMPHAAARGTGISVLTLDAASGQLDLLATCDSLVNPSYLAVSDDGARVYAVEELDEADGGALVLLNLDRATGRLTVSARQGAQGDCPCHLSLSQDETCVMIANYMTGNFVCYALDPSGAFAGEGQKIQRHGSGPNPDRQEGPHVHQVAPSAEGEGVFVCDTGTDEILHYPFSATGIDPAPDQLIKARPGSLPRHLVQSADGGMLFVVHELGCTITSYRRTADGFRQVAEVATLPEEWAGANACAAIRLHPNGRFLYVSNRGADNIAAFRIEDAGGLTPLGWFSTLGRTPRDFNIDPSGRFLIAANQDSHTLCLFGIDRQSGALSAIGAPMAIGSPTCIAFA